MPNFIDTAQDIKNWASAVLGWQQQRCGVTASSSKWTRCEENNNNDKNGYDSGYGDGGKVQTSRTGIACQ